MSWENEKPGYLKIAEGTEKEFTVLTITEKEGVEIMTPGKITNIPGKSYYYIFDTDQGTLIVGNLGLVLALTGAGVREGDRIKVKYIKKGSIGKPSLFEVTTIKKANDLEQPF